jgi:hypothetical protein
MERSRKNLSDLKCNKSSFLIQKSPYTQSLSKSCSVNKDFRLFKVKSIVKKKNLGFIYSSIINSFVPLKEPELEQSNASICKNLINKIFEIPNETSELLLNKYRRALDAVAGYFKPYSQVLQIINNEITKKFPEKLEFIGQTIKSSDLEEKIQTLTKEIEDLKTEKFSLIKKLNKSVEKLEKSINENIFLQKKYNDLQKKFKISCDRFLNAENVAENTLKQTETIQILNSRIKTLLSNEMKLKKIIQHAITQGYSLEKYKNKITQSFYE